MDASGGVPQQVVGPANLLAGFAWTPDGSRLIISSAEGSTITYPSSYNLRVVPIDGGDPAQLTFGESSYEFPDVGREGRLVVSRIRTQSDIWKFPITGEPADNVRRGIRITRQTGQVRTVTISPDENEVAFLSDSGGHINVWVARVADGQMRQITRETDPRVALAVPFWSPHGDKITFLSTRNSTARVMTAWLVNPDGTEPRDLGVGAGNCWSGDGRWLYYQDFANGVFTIKKANIDDGQKLIVRSDNAIGCAAAPEGSVLFYARALTQTSGIWDFEIRVAKPENGPSELLGRVSGSRVPVSPLNFQSYLSPDGKWLGMPLNDGSTSNLWALSTSGGAWRKLTDFRPRNVVIPRRVAWSKDGKYLYASVAEMEADIVMLSGLNW